MDCWSCRAVVGTRRLARSLPPPNSPLDVPESIFAEVRMDSVPRLPDSESAIHLNPFPNQNDTRSRSASGVCRRVTPTSSGGMKEFLFPFSRGGVR